MRRTDAPPLIVCGWISDTVKLKGELLVWVRHSSPIYLPLPAVALPIGAHGIRGKKHIMNV